MITPCVGLCRLKDNICQGCGRSIGEIAQWTQLTDQQRQAIVQRLNETHTGNICGIS